MFRLFHIEELLTLKLPEESDENPRHNAISRKARHETHSRLHLWIRADFLHPRHHFYVQYFPLPQTLLLYGRLLLGLFLDGLFFPWTLGWSPFLSRLRDAINFVPDTPVGGFGMYQRGRRKREKRRLYQ